MPDDARRKRRTEPKHFGDRDVDEELGDGCGRERGQNGRDLFAAADEAPRALIGGVRGDRDGDASPEQHQVAGPLAVDDT